MSRHRNLALAAACLTEVVGQKMNTRAAVLACIVLALCGCQSRLARSPIPDAEISDFWWSEAMTSLHRGTYYLGTTGALHHFRIDRRFPAPATYFAIGSGSFVVPQERPPGRKVVKCDQWFLRAYPRTVSAADQDVLSRILSLPEGTTAPSESER